MSFIPKDYGDALKGGSRPFLEPRHIKADGQLRFAMLANEPFCYFQCWGEDAASNPMPFRFAHEATPEEIEESMGDNYTRRLEKNGDVQPLKFTISIPIYNYETSRVEIFSMNQKNLIKEFDQISQVEEYIDMTEWDFIVTKSATVSPDMYGLRPVPRKPELKEKIEASWSSAQKTGFDITRMLVNGNPFKPET